MEIYQYNEDELRNGFGTKKKAPAKNKRMIKQESKEASKSNGQRGVKENESKRPRRK